MRHSYFFATAAALVFLAGCNTVMERAYQEVTISTPDVEGVDCVMETGKNRYRVIAPGSTQVERSPYDMTVTCEKANYFTATRTVEPKIHMGWSLLTPPAVPYDVASRSIYDYPDEIRMDMIPDLEAMEAARALLTDPVSELKKKERPVAEEEIPSTEGDKAVDKALRK